MVRDWTPEELAELREREARIPTLRAAKSIADRCFNHEKRRDKFYWTKEEILAVGANMMCEECMVELGLIW